MVPVARSVARSTWQHVEGGGLVAAARRTPLDHGQYDPPRQRPPRQSLPRVGPRSETAFLSPP